MLSLSYVGRRGCLSFFVRRAPSAIRRQSYSKLGSGPNAEVENEWAQAIIKEDVGACARLLSSNKTIHDHKINQEGWTALHAAAAKGNKKLFNLLLATGSNNLDCLDRTGMTPLHWAAFRGNKYAVQKLLDKGANVHLKDSSGADAEVWALTGGHKEIAGLLGNAKAVAAGAVDVDELNEDELWILSVYGMGKRQTQQTSSSSNSNKSSCDVEFMDLQEQLADERNRATANMSKLQHYSEVRTLVNDLIEEDKRRLSTVRTLQKCQTEIARKFKVLADYMAVVNVSDATEAEKNKATHQNVPGSSSSTSENKPARHPAQVLELRRKALRDMHLGFESHGIGGLDSEITRLMEEVLLSRALSPTDREAFGITHNKGILLYGPPGNGKTLIARTVANLLQCTNVTVVNGSELDARWVGETEKNIKALFTQASQDWKQFGDDSELHCIIFDEIDSIGGRRGRDVNRHGDRALNMLLACIDGVEQVGNLIIFGLTNRKDMLDPALIRAGRLGTHIEIRPPGLKARESILRVHTATMRKSNRLASDVDLTQLALKTQGYSGADLMDLVTKSLMLTLRSSFVQSGAINGDKLPPDVKVTRATFEQAMELIERKQPR